MTERTNGYNYATVLFHWITVLWVVTMMVLGIVFHEMAFSDPMYLPLSSAHVILGLFGIFFFTFRVVRRLKNGFKSHPEHNIVERILSRGVMYVFLVLLIVVPVTGTLVVFGDGWPLVWGLEVPYIDALFPVVEFAGEAHDVLTKVLFVSMVLHIAGAIKHAVIDKDDTLMGILKPEKGGK